MAFWRVKVNRAVKVIVVKKIESMEQLGHFLIIFGHYGYMIDYIDPRRKIISKFEDLLGLFWQLAWSCISHL